MKVAIYIVDGTTQIVLTPEDKFETASLDHLHAPNTRLGVHRGEFYECRGGWYREANDTRSTMLRIDRAEPQPVEEALPFIRNQRDRLRNALLWALGVNGEFEKPEGARGAFWWRTELRERAGITAEEINALALAEAPTD